MSLLRKSSASIFSFLLGSFVSASNESPSNDFNDGDERNELLLLLDKIDDGSKLRSRFSSSVEHKIDE